ncbi:Hypothetical protein, putative [Bodo saltans]|uniref:Uncharacterized protein n=1 Tax=Bodo saltans TaxID=75058 RepID=A0A0S4JML9_BODSA|nr:Hypothetical protein, putative [Bodo saltans]|eukprot:CUG92737.1 Hypothetical protein, putative [Bodo saltans]
MWRRVLVSSPALLEVRSMTTLGDKHLRGTSPQAPVAPRTASQEDVVAYHRALHEWQWTQSHFGSSESTANTGSGSHRANSHPSSSPSMDDVVLAKSNGGLVVLAIACAGLFSFVQYVKGSVYEELLHRTPTIKYDEEMERMRRERKKGGEEAAKEIATKLALQGAFLQKMVAKVKRERQQYTASNPNPNPKNKP